MSYHMTADITLIRGDRFKNKHNKTGTILIALNDSWGKLYSVPLPFYRVKYDHLDYELVEHGKDILKIVAHVLDPVIPITSYLYINKYGPRFRTGDKVYDNMDEKIGIIRKMIDDEYTRRNDWPNRDYYYIIDYEDASVNEMTCERNIDIIQASVPFTGIKPVSKPFVSRYPAIHTIRFSKGDRFEHTDYCNEFGNYKRGVVELARSDKRTYIVTYSDDTTDTLDERCMIRLGW